MQQSLQGNDNEPHGRVANTWWTPPRADREELIDRDQPSEDFEKCFRDIRLANRLFGGVAVVLDRMAAILGNSKEPISVLDVATGAGDIPQALLRWGEERGQRICITAIDANEKVLRFARKEIPEGIATMQGDARSLPFADGAFDFAICSLTFHHFDDETACEVLREMLRVSRKGILVNDLRRGYLPAFLIWLVTRLLLMNRLTRHDASLSVLRSRTITEYERLSQMAGLPNAEVRKHPFWRASIVARR